VRNTLANGLGSFSVVALSIVLTPFLIGDLGTEGYGVWTLALTLTFFGGYAALTDLGIETAAIRFIAEGRSNQDDRQVDEVTSSAFAFFLGVGLVLTPLLIVLAEELVGVLKIDASLEDEATFCFAVVAAQLVFELPSRAFFAVLEGIQRFPVYQAIEIMRALVQAVLFVGVLVLDLGIEGLAVALLISSVVVLLTSWLVVRKVVPDLSVSPRNVSRPRMREMVGYGTGMFSLRILGTIYRQMDKAILGVGLGAKYVTVYEIANKIHGGIALIQSVAASALTPAAAFSRREPEIVREMYLRGSCYTVAASMPAIVAGIVFAGPLVESWVGDDLTEAIWPTQIFLIYLALVSFHVVGSTIIAALGRLRMLITVSSLIVLGNLALSLILVGPYEVEGVIWGTVIANIVGWPLLLAMFLRNFGIGLGEWLRRVVLPNLPGALVQVAVSLPLLELAESNGRLYTVAALALVSALVSVATFLLVGLRGQQRDLLFRTVREAVSARPAA
jgi:O-antigen/teichoic acid export membrane protein